jgi:transposase-like protein
MLAPIAASSTAGSRRQDRSLSQSTIGGDRPYLWLVATYVKARENGRIVSVAASVAVAVNGGGRREVLGMAVGASEAETFRTEFLRALARRGLRGVKLVISDAHEGLKAAVPGARDQPRYGVGSG